MSITRNITVLWGYKSMQKMRLTPNEVCHLLSVQRDKLNKLVKDDPIFQDQLKRVKLDNLLCILIIVNW